MKQRPISVISLLRKSYALAALFCWHYGTFQINPTSPTKARAIVRMNELRDAL